MPEAGGIVRVGISDFAQDQLGDIIYVELPAVGARVTQSQKMGEVESVKAVSELFSPVSGEVVEVNSKAVDSPQLLNEDPYHEGWLLCIRVDDPGELETLLDSGQYQEITAS